MFSVIRTLATVLGALSLVACAHSSEQIHSSTVSHEVSPEEREVLAIDQANATTPPETPKAPPRLSRTVTLGQNNTDAEYVGPAAPRPTQPQGPNGTNVVINNNVVVNGGAPAYGYYGYGYRGYGYSPSYARGAMSRPTTTPQWGTTGWEGARRTAAPGQTPGIGGNWPSAPSYGPAPMR